MIINFKIINKTTIAVNLVDYQAIMDAKHVVVKFEGKQFELATALNITEIKLSNETLKRALTKWQLLDHIRSGGEYLYSELHCRGEDLAGFHGLTVVVHSN